MCVLNRNAAAVKWAFALIRGRGVESFSCFGNRGGFDLVVRKLCEMSRRGFIIIFFLIISRNSNFFR